MSTQSQAQSQAPTSSQAPASSEAPTSSQAASPARPPASGRLAAATAPARRPALLGEVAVVAILVFVYDRVRDVAAARSGQAFDNARNILDVEGILHLDPERTLNAWLAGHEGAGFLASWYYQAMHLSVTLAVLVLLYARRVALYRHARNALVLVNVIGLMVFWLFPVAPPRFFPGFVDTGVVTGVTSHVSEVSANLYAAMPSLHIGWAAWVVLHAWAAKAGRVLKSLVVTHLALTTLIILATANHYLIDVLAGFAVAALATVLSRTPVPGRSRQPAVAAVDHVR